LIINEFNYFFFSLQFLRKEYISKLANQEFLAYLIIFFVETKMSIDDYDDDYEEFDDDEKEYDYDDDWY